MEWAGPRPPGGMAAVASGTTARPSSQAPPYLGASAVCRAPCSRPSLTGADQSDRPIAEFHPNGSSAVPRTGPGENRAAGARNIQSATRQSVSQAAWQKCALRMIESELCVCCVSFSMAWTPFECEATFSRSAVAPRGSARHG